MGAYDTDLHPDVEPAVDVVNVEQAAAWDGHEGDVWTEQADRYDRASRRMLQRFLDAQLIGSTDRVVDVGCGTGGLTRAAARVATAGEVTGLDLSTQMLELARRRSVDEGLENVRFTRADAQVFPFRPAALDVAASSYGCMFFNDPVAAFTNIAGGLRSGGTLALVAWRTLQDNEWLTALRAALALGRDLPVPPPDAPTPFSLAEPARVNAILGAAGFDQIEMLPIDEPIDLGVDAAEALAFAQTMGIVEGLTHDLGPAERAQTMTNLAELFRANETTDGVLLGAASWLITARRT